MIRRETKSQNRTRKKLAEKATKQKECLCSKRDKRVDDIDKKVKLYGSSYQESRVKI